MRSFEERTENKLDATIVAALLHFLYTKLYKYIYIYIFQFICIFIINIVNKVFNKKKCQEMSTKCFQKTKPSKQVFVINPMHFIFSFTFL